MFVYLDNSATTKPSEACVSAMRNALEKDFGNPSSLHRPGLEAEKLVKSARQTLAASVGASTSELYFTSCGTESDNTAIFGAYEARKHSGNRIITTAVEHPAVLRCFEELRRRGAEVVYIPVEKDGNLNLKALSEALTQDTVLLSVMHVNNETGAVFPISEISGMLDGFYTKKGLARPVFHSDCVQSYGKIPVDVVNMGVDMISISGHKVHASKGIGALYVKKSLHIPPYIFGGGQERGFRSGTENVAGIAGFGAAVAEGKSLMDGAVKDYLKKLLIDSIEDIQINSPDNGAPSVLNVSFMGCRAEVLLHMLEQDEIYVSTGSACSSHSKGSHVLSAQGLSPQAIEGALRFSFSHDNTMEQMEYVTEKLSAYVKGQRRLRSAFRR